MNRSISSWRALAARALSQVDYVYLWAGGVHVNIRLEEHKLCLLLVMTPARRLPLPLMRGLPSAARVR